MEPFLQEHQAPFIPRSQIPWHSALALAAPEGSSVPLLPHRWGKNHKEWTNPKPKPPGDRSCTLLGLSVGATKCLSQQRTNPFQLLPKLGQVCAARSTPGVLATSTLTIPLHKTPSWSPAGDDTTRGETSPLPPVPPSTNDPQHPRSTLATPGRPPQGRRGAGVTLWGLFARPLLQAHFLILG